ncbi:MAG TPA: hypothetical protein EYQ50_00570 [Verrucomicrobiales bacterium]|nr:hypothetical protein [Verrucomicrobiales bacterium]
MKFCAFIQWLSALDLNESSGLSTLVSKHREHCQDCRDQQQTMEGIEEAMIKEAGDSLHSTPPFLDGKIVSAIQRSRLESPASGLQTFFNWKILMGTFGTVAVLLLSLSIWLNQPSTDFVNPENQVAVPSNLLPDSFINEIPLNQWSRTLDRSIESTLEKEKDLILEDARNALKHLAVNFLPEGISYSDF